MAGGVKGRVGRWAGVFLGIVARTLGAGVLFWAVFPLWLSVFWSVQGYPPTLRDLPRWYALGAFNIAPIVGMVLVSPGALIAARWVARLSARSAFIKSGVIAAMLYMFLTPPMAYALLLVYADMWQYRAWDMIIPTLVRAYLMLAPACGVVGGVIGWSLQDTNARKRQHAKGRGTGFY
ncbi:MAG: hypothetical protein KatS3mg016_1288 [Fimbriimonadales bacterium]|nr:MAG: hypothetical protein KatS3mg016_1288 [Fimbriimonadales bacterium]